MEHGGPRDGGTTGPRDHGTAGLVHGTAGPVHGTAGLVHGTAGLVRGTAGPGSQFPTISPPIIIFYPKTIQKHIKYFTLV